MQLTILGCNAATPRKNAQTTAQLLEIKGQMVLIDCGEGTQIQLRKLGSNSPAFSIFSFRTCMEIIFMA